MLYRPGNDLLETISKPACTVTQVQAGRREISKRAWIPGFTGMKTNGDWVILEMDTSGFIRKQRQFFAK
jgi:hypothetical protein